MNESDLLGAIARDPSNVDRYLVYADWLSGKGDPRGELIAVQVELARAPTEELSAASHRLALSILDELAALISHGVLAIEWRYGFIRAARFSGSYDPELFGPRRRDEYLAALIAHPAARLIEEIAIGDWWVEWDRVFDADIAALERAPNTLRSVSIAPVGDRDVAGRVFGLEGFLRAHPQLVELSLAGESVSFPPRIHLPKLETLSLLEHQPTDPTLSSILTNRWPSLKSISITSSGRPYSPYLALPPRVHAQQFARLESVTIRGALDATMMVLDTIARLPLLAHLKRLELSRCGIGDGGAEVIAAHRDAFANLELLDLEGNEITPAGVEALRQLACPVRV